jgi:signal transduction histidine kinase
MERGAKSAKAKVEARPTVARKPRTVEASTGPQFKQRLAEALEQHAAISEILRVISSSPGDVTPVLAAVAKRAAHLCDASFAQVSLVEGNVLRPTVAYWADAGSDEERDDSRGVKRTWPLTRGMVIGRAVLDCRTIHHADVVPLLDSEYPDSPRAKQQELGFRAVLAVPLTREGGASGVIFIFRREPRPFSPEQVALVETFARQAAIAIQNARLFREIEEKSRELETASRHKSEFLANMSHELRTPLNAIIGFSEVLHERMFGEINEKQAEYLADILESGRHLLSLINDILDLSKIEAGRMELERTDFNLPDTIENTLTLVRERAHRRGITLARTIDECLGMVHADERKVKQVLLNLLSNALKFTPEGGRIDVRAEANGEGAEISVTDNGVGIAPEDQPTVFEEFRQVGAAARKVEGTGLGLAISRKFIELHGGTIWVRSEVGAGSTFTFTLPLATDQHHLVG